jgi:hypothetical protein
VPCARGLRRQALRGVGHCPRLPIGGSTHPAGTCRSGRGPGCRDHRSRGRPAVRSPDRAASALAWGVGRCFADPGPVARYQSVGVAMVTGLTQGPVSGALLPHRTLYPFAIYRLAVGGAALSGQRPGAAGTRTATGRRKAGGARDALSQQERTRSRPVTARRRRRSPRSKTGSSRWSSTSTTGRRNGAGCSRNCSGAAFVLRGRRWWSVRVRRGPGCPVHRGRQPERVAILGAPAARRSPRR